MMTNEELNRMAAGMLGECRHKPMPTVNPGWFVMRCANCDEIIEREQVGGFDYYNDRNHAVRVAEAVDANDMHDALREVWLSARGESRISMPVWVIRQPAKTLLLVAFTAHGIMPMDEAKEAM